MPRILIVQNIFCDVIINYVVLIMLIWNGFYLITRMEISYFIQYQRLKATRSFYQ